ncbi:hypothetical protein JTB14_016974 [Gonioctena quinquepunctata]|nr:hypothetical protein JTB14_016974 [Gonioctena quinquepunctata]
MEKTPSTPFIQHPTHNQMTDRLDILYRQVDEEAEKMTEDLLNNMINHNPKMEGSKHMLRERLRAVYNTSRELCIKSKEQEIHRLNTEKGKKKYVNAPDPGNIWAKRMQERENQNSAREARQPGSGAQETQSIHNLPPNNNAQVGTAVSGGFANENSGQGIKAPSDKFKTLDVNNRNDHDPDDPLPLPAIIASTSTAAPVVDFDRNNSEEHDNSYVSTEISPVKLTDFDNSVS